MYLTEKVARVLKKTSFQVATFCALGLTCSDSIDSNHESSPSSQVEGASIQLGSQGMYRTVMRRGIRILEPASRELLILLPRAPLLPTLASMPEWEVMQARIMLVNLSIPTAGLFVRQFVH
jgi:hypothetical protein